MNTIIFTCIFYSKLTFTKTEIIFFFICNTIYFYRFDCSKICSKFIIYQILKCQSVIVCFLIRCAGFRKYTIIYCNACGCFGFRRVGCAAAAITCLCDCIGYIIIAFCCNDNYSILSCINAIYCQIQNIISGCTVSVIFRFYSECAFFHIGAFFGICNAVYSYACYLIQICCKLCAADCAKAQSVVITIFKETALCSQFCLFNCRSCQLIIFAGVGSCAITFQCIGHCFVTLRLNGDYCAFACCVNAVYSQIQSILITAIGGICNLCTIVIILEVNACCFCVCFRANGYLFDCAQICIQVLTLQTAEGQTVIISAFQ